MISYSHYLTLLYRPSGVTEVAISASLTGAGALTVTLAVATPITAALTGAGALTASLAIETAVSAALTGAGSLSATLGVALPITANLTGTGSLSATLGVPAPAPVPPVRGLTDQSMWLWRPPVRVIPVFEPAPEPVLVESGTLHLRLAMSGRVRGLAILEPPGPLWAPMALRGRVRQRTAVINGRIKTPSALGQDRMSRELAVALLL